MVKSETFYFAVRFASHGESRSRPITLDEARLLRRRLVPDGSRDGLIRDPLAARTKDTSNGSNNSSDDIVFVLCKVLSLGNLTLLDRKNIYRIVAPKSFFIDESPSTCEVNGLLLFHILSEFRSFIPLKRDSG